VGLGCWPISGISSLDVSENESIKTIHAAIDAGINFFDTAYSYGYAGESDLLLAKALAGRTEKVVLATKVGTHYDAQRQRHIDGRPELLIHQAKESLSRLGVDQVAVVYLHTPDPNVPLAESAGAIAELVANGYIQCAGVSNVNLQQLDEFHRYCPVSIVQPYFNMLQSEAVEPIREFCNDHRISIACYWVLMKGVLAGKMQRDHRFDSSDRRLTYPIYQGEAWQRVQNLLDHLRAMAKELGCTVSQLVIAWTLHQPSISCALIGAKRPEQIRETALAMDIELTDESVRKIGRWIEAVHI
jgi:aryl-alcohol dehydrogenase-like predicted oxidoreductase